MAEDGAALAALAGEQFWPTLRLLGFEHSAEAGWLRGKSTRQLGPDMFDGSTSNELGLLGLLHFLLLRLRGAKARKAFARCFPVLDNAQRREFKAQAREMLQDLEREGVLPVGAAKGSTLNMARGKAATVLVYTLATAAVQRECSRMQAGLGDEEEEPVPPAPALVPPGLDLAALKATELARLDATVAQCDAEAAEEEAYAQELLAEAEALRAKIAQADAEVAKLGGGGDRVATVEDAGLALQRQDFLVRLARSPVALELQAGLDRLSLEQQASGHTALHLPPGYASAADLVEERLGACIEAAQAATRKARETVLSPGGDADQLEATVHQVEALQAETAELCESLAAEEAALNSERAAIAGSLLEF